mmetsp:Transcript_20000/g.14712  ORF Transcript_20000/g.14712 Transcript_20000/m.14712 type:complete len:93 (+) Transcript_20000:23-301(+)
MLKFENWTDLFKFNKELLDDDYNPGQRYVAKKKFKSEDGSTEVNFTCKQSHHDGSGNAKINTELKVKQTLEGTTMEGVIKNDRTCTSEIKSD